MQTTYRIAFALDPHSLSLLCVFVCFKKKKKSMSPPWLRKHSFIIKNNNLTKYRK